VHAMAPVPPLSGAVLQTFLFQLGLLLLVATVLGRVAVRLSLPAVVGELAAGILLGPSLIGGLAGDPVRWLATPRAEQLALLDGIAQVGVILLVTVTGMQLDLGLVRRHASSAVAVSLPGFLIPLGLGVGAAYFVPASLLGPHDSRMAPALFLGLALAVSAIPVIARILLDMDLLDTRVGQLILVTGAIDDLLAWLSLSALVAAVGSGDGAGGLLHAYLVFGIAGAAVAFVGRPLIHTLLRATTRSPDPIGTISVAVVVVIGLCALSQAVGLEALFGAMAAGIIIRGAGPEVVERLPPIRTVMLAVLAPIFFGMVGYRLDVTALADPPVLLAAAGLLVLAVAGKLAGGFLGGWLSGLERWETLALGGGINARGVVQIVIATIGMRMELISTAGFTVIVMIAVATSLMSPGLLRFALNRMETMTSASGRSRPGASRTDPEVA
jgi:Kef-type K+ transport system membrane component KefB